jgi:flavin reductase ActVB
MPVSAERYKELLSRVAGGVAVITTGDLSAADGRAWAFTAISYCGVSLDPPLVLFCLERSADCHEAFLAADRFAINILAADQQAVSERFAMKGDAKYEGFRFEAGVSGLPLVPGALAAIECRVQSLTPGGDHSIFIGVVEAGRVAASVGGDDTADPLVYYSRAYGTFTPLPVRMHEE